MSILSIENIKKNYGDNEVLKGISFSIEKGEVVAIIGSSGGGKSTLLRCLTFLEKIDSGKIIINDKEIVKTDEKGKAVYPKEEELRQYALKIGLIFQDFNLFPHLSVIDNLTLALKLVKKYPKAKAEEIALEYLKKVGLEDKKNEYPYKISGGQKQRVAIARALCLEPEILCFDEPTSALDPELTGEVLKVIKSLKSTNVTMLIVTHEIMFAREVADNIIFIDKGVIAEQGEAHSIVDKPQNDRTKAFMEKIINKE